MMKRKPGDKVTYKDKEYELKEFVGKEYVTIENKDERICVKVKDIK